MWHVALLGTDVRYAAALSSAAALDLFGGAALTDPGDWDRALDDPDISAVVVAAPLSERAYWSARAMERGKHAVTCLPVAPSARASLDLARQAWESGRHLVIDGDLACSAAARDLVRDVEGGVIGAPVYLRLRLEAPRAAVRDSPEGVLAMFGIRLVRLTTLLCGRLDTVYARARALCANRPTEDLAVAQLSFANGAEGLIEISAVDDRAAGTIAVVGTEGTRTMPLEPDLGMDADASCADLRRALEGQTPNCGSLQLRRAAVLVEWISQAARRNAETARADVIIN